MSDTILCLIHQASRLARCALDTVKLYSGATHLDEVFKLRVFSLLLSSHWHFSSAPRHTMLLPQMDLISMLSSDADASLLLSLTDLVDTG